uniref:Uncharacterized protein n=1 Tax=Timema poppense TaxID=170557 RepID=A0A7R9CRK0_TIMPO|nr:unnamed protein product [Timema poppensis]
MRRLRIESRVEDISLEVTTTAPRDNTESSESKSDSSDERTDELTVDTRRRKGKKANPGKRGPSGGKVNVITGNLPSKQRKKGKGSLSSHKANGGGRKEANSHVPKVTEPPLITFDPTQHPNWKLFEKDRCGLGSRDRIIGGQDAEPGWYPWIARIGYLNLRVLNFLRYSSSMASLVLTESSHLTADGFEKLPDQIMYPYTKPYDLQKHVFTSCRF